MLHDFLPVIIAALTVLVFGCWNPKGLQCKDKSGKPTGYPNYMWLALLSLVLGGLAALLYSGSRKSYGV